MNDQVRRFEEIANGIPVAGFLHSPEETSRSGIVLTHGAGANCQAPLLFAIADAFCAAGMTVLRCDLPFRQTRAYGPPPRGSAEGDQQGLRAAADSMRGSGVERVYLGGHSNGGRQASMLLAEDPAVADGLLLLSYPLHPPMQREQLRTAHFPQLRTSAMFVHGSRDGFGTHEELRQALELIPARTELLEIIGAGHELLTKANREELPRKVVQAFRDFYELGSQGPS